MKIAFIVNQFPLLSETFVLLQITGLLERGHQVDIFAYSSTNDPVMHPDIQKYDLLKRTYYLTACGSSQTRIIRLVKRIGLLITNFHKNPSAVLKTLNVIKFGKDALLLRVLYQISPFLNKGPYDILHCQFGPLGELGLLLKDTGVFRGKVVTSFRGYDISSHVRSQGTDVYDDLFRTGDLFLCVSECIKENLIKLGCDERKIVVHRSGIDMKKFVLLSREPKGNRETRILTIARLVEKKGVEYGIRAVAKILKVKSHIEYRIAGDGPLRARIEGLIEEFHVRSHIRLLGWKSEEEITELLKESDILVAPSVTSETGDQEGIPGVIMEAFAQGLPVISTYHAGIPEVVKDGESGFLVPERDVDGLAEKLALLIDRPELRSAMGLEGRNFVEKHYNVDKLNDRLERIYRQLLDGKLPGTEGIPVARSRDVSGLA